MPRKRKEIPDGFNEKFPQRLRELIKEKGETQQGLADYIGRTRQLISYYCDGSSSPDWKTLGQIATYFNVTSDYLIGLSDAKQPENSDIVERLGLTERTITAFRELKITSEETSGDQPITLMQITDEFIANLLDSVSIWALYDLCLNMTIAKEMHYQKGSFFALLGNDENEYRNAKNIVEENGCLVIGGSEAIEFKRLSVRKWLDNVVATTISKYEKEYESYVDTRDSASFGYLICKKISHVEDEIKRKEYVDSLEQIMNSQINASEMVDRLISQLHKIDDEISAGAKDGDD